MGVITDQPRPYLGAMSFRTQDRHLFYGRKNDCMDVVALSLANRIALLHASSGTGKTSLINAGLVPNLEETGFVCVVARPFKDPERSLIEETLARLLPRPRHEAAALRRAVVALDKVGIADVPGLRGLRLQVNRALTQSSDFLAVRGPIRVDDDPRMPRGEVTPFVVRFLTSAGRPLLLARQISALAKLAGIEPPSAEAGTGLVEGLANMPIDDLIRFFDDDRLDRAWSALTHNLTLGRPSPNTFFDKLTAFWGRQFDEFAVVLILDQFEELFTQFTNQRTPADPPADDAEVLGRRDSYFKALAELMPRRDLMVRFPLNILISMRDDYIAEIDQFERWAGPVQRSARFHLRLLDQQACRDAIEEPARHFGISYERATLQRLATDLSSDNEETEPGHIQIVCDRLHQQLQDIGSGREIGEAHLHELGGVGGILASYFERFLEQCTATAAPGDEELDHLEIMHLLEPLMTSHGTRNIVERHTLVHVRFRDPARRLWLLRQMSDARIIRTEQRLNGAYVEITHEFLIRPISQEIRKLRLEGTLYTPLNGALAKLERIAAQGPGTVAAEALDSRDYEALWRYRNRLPILQHSYGGNGLPEASQPGDAWIAEFMLRTAALVSWTVGETTERREQIRYWASVVDAVSELPPLMIRDRLSCLAPGTGRLDAVSVRTALQTPVSEEFDPVELRLVVISAIETGKQDLSRQAARWYVERCNAAA